MERRGKKERGKKKGKEKKKSITEGFEPATFHSTGIAYSLKVESHVPYPSQIDDLIVAALAPPN